MPPTASGPVVSTMPPMASGAYAAPRGDKPHATMIGAVAPVAMGRSSPTAPPPPLAPSTVPPASGAAMFSPSAPPGHTPHGFPSAVPSSQPYPVQHPSSQPYPAQATPHGYPAVAGPTSQPYPAQAMAAQAGSTPGATTVALTDPPAGTPAWAMGPRGDHPLRSPEYLQAAAAYSTDLARGTPEPAVAPGPVAAPAAKKSGSTGLIVVLVIGLAAAVGGFFVVQHFL